MENNKEKSEYQRIKFMNKYTIAKLKSNQEKTKVIAIMLDLQGTLDDMTDETAQIFMQQLSFLMTKFKATQAIINISTHTGYPSPTLQKYMTILNNNLLPNIILDEATCLFGTYNFYTQEHHYFSDGSNNLNKAAVFEQHYLNHPTYQVVWFGIADDDLNPKYYQKFQNNTFMAEFIPSLSQEENKYYDNLMCSSTLTFGFLGLIECIDTYINNIKDISLSQLLKAQQSILPYLNQLDITQLFYNKNFHEVLKHLKANKISPTSYETIMRELHLCLQLHTISPDDLLTLNEIFNYIAPHLNPHDQHLLEFTKITEHTT